MNRNKLILLSLSTLLVTTSCIFDRKESESESELESESEDYSYSISQEEDTIGLIPQDVLNYQGSIDILTYIEGQNGTVSDIGRPNLASSQIVGGEFARYVGAARAFKKLAPGVKINLIYCSINEYNDTLMSYSNQTGHLPHLMHPVDDFYEMIENGYVMDLSAYKDSEYFQSFNQMYFDNVTFNGFISAIPTHIAPYGMFVNKDILKREGILTSNSTDEYVNWINSLTIDEFLDVCKSTYLAGTNSAISHMMDIAGSFIYEDIFLNYVNDESHQIALNNSNIEHLIDVEAELWKYSSFDYTDDGRNGIDPNIDFGPDGWRNWEVVQRTALGGHTFNLEMPWNIGLMSQYVDTFISEGKLTSAPDIDFMPYPRQDENHDFVIGNAVGGLQVGNLCPIGESGKEECYSSTARLQQDVAAYFAMFMVNDPRAIYEESIISYPPNTDTTDPSQYSTGYVSLPLQDPSFKFSFQEDPDVMATLDPNYQTYNDPYRYQLSLYLKTYPLYLTNNEEPDLDNFSNVKSGFAMVLDYLNNHKDRVVNARTAPTNIQEGTDVVDIMKDWNNRYEVYSLTSENYAANLKADLSRLEDYINDKTETAYEFLVEMLDMFYGTSE